MTSPTAPDDTLRDLRLLVGNGRFREAVDFYHGHDDSAWRANPEAQLLTATSATRLGEFEVAAPLALAASERFRVAADRHGRMRANNLLGVVFIEQGRVGEAESYLGEALALAHELADSLMAARAASNLATLAHMGNRIETALSLYRSALVTYQRIGDRQGLIEIYHNFGIVFRQNEQFDQAMEANENALRLAESTADPGLIAPALTGIAEIRLAMGEGALAVREAQRARELAESAGDPLVVAEADRILALAWLSQDNLQEAQDAAGNALRLAVEHRSALLVGEATAAMALVLRAMGRDVEAEARQTQARASFTALGAAGFLAEFDRVWGGIRD